MDDITFPNECAICKAGPFGAQWTRELLMGTKSPEEAAKRFSMPVAQVMIHITEHQIVKQNEETGDIESDDIYVSRMVKLLKNMQDWVDYLMKEGEVNKGTVDSLTKLVREIRTTLVTVADFQGRTDGNKTKTKVESLEVTMFNLTNLLIKEACPVCQAKVIELLETQTMTQETLEIPESSCLQS
jgi:hypothetical protein